MTCPAQRSVPSPKAETSIVSDSGAYDHARRVCSGDHCSGLGEGMTSSVGAMSIFRLKTRSRSVPSSGKESSSAGEAPLKYWCRLVGGKPVARHSWCIRPRSDGCSFIVRSKLKIWWLGASASRRVAA